MYGNLEGYIDKLKNIGSSIKNLVSQERTKVTNFLKDNKYRDLTLVLTDSSNLTTEVIAEISNYLKLIRLEEDAEEFEKKARLYNEHRRR